MGSSSFEVDTLLSSLPPAGNHSNPNDAEQVAVAAPIDGASPPPRSRTSPRSRTKRHDPPGSIDNHRSFVLADDYCALEGANGDGYDDDDGDDECQDSSDRSPEQESVCANRFLETDRAGRENEDLNSGGRGTGRTDAAGRTSAGRKTANSASRAPPRTRSGDTMMGETDSPVGSLPVSGRTSGGQPSALAENGGIPERKLRGVARPSSMTSEGGPRAQTRVGRRVASRAAMARSKSCEDSMLLLQMAAAADSSLRRTQTRKDRAVGRCRSESTGPQAALRTDLSKRILNPGSDSAPLAIEGSVRVPVASNVTNGKMSRDTPSQDSKGDVSASSSQTAKVPQRNSRPSKAGRGHSSKRPTSSGNAALSHRPGRSDTSSRRNVRSHSSDPTSRRRHIGETGEADSTLDSKTFHVSRSMTDSKQGCRDRTVYSSLQLNIGDPSNVDLASFPALLITNGEFDPSLQRDAGDHSVVGTHAFPSADDGVAPAPSVGDTSRVTSMGALLLPVGSQPAKEASSGLLLRMQSHILRNPIFASQP